MKVILKTLLFLLIAVLLWRCEKEETVELPSVNIDITNITTISAIFVGEITNNGGGNILGRVNAQSDGLCMCSAGLKVMNFQIRT